MEGAYTGGPIRKGKRKAGGGLTRETRKTRKRKAGGGLHRGTYKNKKKKS